MTKVSKSIGVIFTIHRKWACQHLRTRKLRQNDLQLSKNKLYLLSKLGTARHAVGV